MKLLIADDNQTIRQMIRRLVADLADEICECADGAEAIVLYRRLHPDWVLMDLEMPGVNGLMATQTILREDPAARVLIVTNYSDAGLRQAATAAGVRGYVLKENLLDLRQWLSDERGPEADLNNPPITTGKGTLS